jgi:hypothetical protein
LNDNASPNFPAVDHAAFTNVPLLPFPDASAVEPPCPSSNPNAATGVGAPPPPDVDADAVFEYGPRLVAASVARTRYEYDVDADKPVSLNVVAPDVVPTCAKFEQPDP